MARKPAPPDSEEDLQRQIDGAVESNRPDPNAPNKKPKPKQHDDSNSPDGEEG